MTPDGLQELTGYRSFAEMPDKALATYADLYSALAANLRREMIRRETAKLGGGKVFKGSDPKPGRKK